MPAESENRSNLTSAPAGIWRRDRSYSLLVVADLWSLTSTGKAAQAGRSGTHLLWKKMCSKISKRELESAVLTVDEDLDGDEGIRPNRTSVRVRCAHIADESREGQGTGGVEGDKSAIIR